MSCSATAVQDARTDLEALTPESQLPLRIVLEQDWYITPPLNTPPSLCEVNKLQLIRTLEAVRLPLEQSRSTGKRLTESL